MSQQNLKRKKFAGIKIALSFSELFSKFFVIFNGENTLFTKSAQKWSRFRKKLLYFFPYLVCSSGPIMEFFQNFLIFFLNLPKV